MLALLLACGACSSVPTSSKPVVVGPAPVAVAGDIVAEPEVRQQEAAPQPGATPSDIVDGFLKAAADRSTDGREIAAQYLLRGETLDDAGADTFVFTSYQQ